MGNLPTLIRHTGRRALVPALLLSLSAAVSGPAVAADCPQAGDFLEPARYGDAGARYERPALSVWCDGAFQTLPADFDVEIINTATGAPVAASSSFDNTYEVARFLADPNVVYEVRVKVFTPLASQAYLALAYMPEGG